VKRSFVQYVAIHREGCLAVFDSNANQYFASYERGLFADFLEARALSEPFFVLLESDRVIGCGGYYRQGGIIYLNWGMIERSQHGSGHGRFLLDRRIEQIRTECAGLPIRIETTQHTQGFFQKNGFDVISRASDGFAAGLDRVEMEREAEKVRPPHLASLGG
jgi:GNAT superfamily N-acetyltransferase